MLNLMRPAVNVSGCEGISTCIFSHGSGGGHIDVYQVANNVRRASKTKTQLLEPACMNPYARIVWEASN
jgi:hypothetical protein